MFRAMPECARVYLLNHGETALREDISIYGVDPADVVYTDDVASELDVLLAAGAAIEPDRLRSLREGGCRIIAYKGGNGAVISMEAVVARPTRPDAERYFDADCYDAIWLTPQHWPTYRGWCETVYRCPVHRVSQVWSPLFVEKAAGEKFGYRPGRRPWRIGVMDPNITVMKTSHMPMLVCEAAFRTSPDAFAAFYIANGQPHRDNAHFASFTTSLTAAKAGKMTLEPRYVGVQFLADHCDALVTHQWENALNYLYYEALYGNYPLIHNSSMLPNLGYPYPAFDAEAGAEALGLARQRHDQTLAVYNQNGRNFLAGLEPSAKILRNEANRLLAL